MTFTNALREKPSKTVMGNQEPGAKAEKQTLDYLFSVTYEELRRLASTVKEQRRQAYAESDGTGERGLAEAGEIAAFRDHLTIAFQAHCGSRHAAGADRSGPTPQLEQAWGRNSGARSFRMISIGRDAFAARDMLALEEGSRSSSVWNRVRPGSWRADFSEGWTCRNRRVAASVRSHH